ncbi:hypothetical protein RDWZM_007922 [Blomia tropicalis]|uniref:Uncharacterized protein n=1 Tax=Blomia tropicalis TaxID=40697 RepID=A0A9Q0M004_BLOTA|nr:hypothetical protein RDWZM_007922 [Blomia tropicalis]
MLIIAYALILMASRFTFIHTQSYIDTTDDHNMMPNGQQCEPIVIPLCEGIQYNTTMMPNLLGHLKQEQAGLELHQYMPLVKIQCSPNLQIFLCSIFVPLCTVLEKPIPPCRSLCLSARNGCEGLMNKFGFNWPENLDCNKFPIGSKSDLCFGEPGEPSSSGESSISSGGSNYMETKQSDYSPSLSSSSSSSASFNNMFPFKCPLQLKVPNGLGHTIRLQGKEHKDCGMPCDDLLLESNERHLIRIWTGTWAIFCVISTLFTVFTYFIEPDRFNFPERSIIFLSCCYFFIGLVFVYGFFFGDSVACNDPFPSELQASNLQMARTITQGNRKEKCTLSFMTLYFFTISNSIWWVVLTVTWFMTVTLLWGNEPVEANSHCFHLFSWAISAVMTIIVLAMNKIEGDFLTGVCFIGIWNPTYLIAFVLIPLALFLIVGFLFLSMGFISMWRARSFIKQNKSFRPTPLDKQMFKIGVFSILYFVPTLLLLACFYYEQENVDSFLMYWLNQACKKPEYGIHCPAGKIGSKAIASAALMGRKPHFSIYFIKYFVWLMPGIASGFWIWSEKTVSSWTRLIRRMFCLEPRIDYV